MQRYLWIAAIVIVALAAGWWLGRGTAPARGSMAAENADADSGHSRVNARANAPKRPVAHTQSSTPANTASVSKPLPPPGTPLKQTFDELKARADAGDVEAASRLLRDTLRCQKFRRLRQIVPQFAKMALAEKVDDASKDQLRISSQMLDAAHDQLKYLHDNEALCDGTPNNLAESVLPVALETAQLGDLTAINCYVGGGGEFGLPSGLIDHPEWLVEYKENALSLANTAVEKGNWTMVSQLALAYGESYPTSLLPQVTGNDPAMAYRYGKLSLLGAPSADKDKAVAHLQSRLDGLAEGLTAEQKAAADAWAQNAYMTYFEGTPNNTAYNHFSTCPASE